MKDGAATVVGGARGRKEMLQLLTLLQDDVSDHHRSSVSWQEASAEVDGSRRSGCRLGHRCENEGTWD